jgi:quercetin dioxygenase-like cupin family protein
MYHREYTLAGSMRYLMEDGTVVISKPGDFLFIEPGHRAWVEGNDTAVLLDW